MGNEQGGYRSMKSDVKGSMKNLLEDFKAFITWGTGCS